MIKFNCLIHKETGIVIKYEDWKELYSCDNGKVLPIENGLKYYYDSKEMLFSDDFIIIYDSEFTTEELKTIECCINTGIEKYPHAKMYNERNKVCKIIKEREYYKKYGIEV